jgi:ABC 3 transport family
VATIVAVVGGTVGFFVVLRGSAFVAHAVPNGSFAGAAAASLIGISAIVGLGVFSVGGALGIGLLGRRGRHDVATALTLVFMLGLGALFLSFSVEYAPEIYSLLFGEVLGISTNQLGPTIGLALVSPAALALLYRPLLYSSTLPDSAQARGIGPFRDRDRVPPPRRARHHDDRPRGRDRAHLQPDDRPAGDGAGVHHPAVGGDRALGSDRADRRVGGDRAVVADRLAGRVLRRHGERRRLRRRTPVGLRATPPKHALSRRRPA